MCPPPCQWEQKLPLVASMSRPLAKIGEQSRSHVFASRQGKLAIAKKSWKGKGDERHSQCISCAYPRHDRAQSKSDSLLGGSSSNAASSDEVCDSGSESSWLSPSSTSYIDKDIGHTRSTHMCGIWILFGQRLNEDFGFWHLHSGTNCA